MDSCSIIPQPNKFVLSLDALDLGLLPSTYLSSLKPSSIWTVNKHPNDYVQFEIRPKTESVLEESDSNTKDISTETTKCYICNTEVPVAYLPDHEESLKHKAFAKITNVVLERARQQMLKKSNTSNLQKIESTYFCEACVSIVHNSDRNSHKKSESHKRSVSLDKLLNELVALYTNNNDTEELTDDNANFVTENNNYDTNMVLISDINACLYKHEAELNKERSFDAKMNYIRLLDEYDVEKLNTLTPEGDNIRIGTQDGAEVIVPEDNFHGFKRLGERHIQCKLCKIIVKDEHEHKNSEAHIRKIVKPFPDKHCVRALDNSWSHCVICNEVIDNSDVHSLCNDAHNKSLQKALVPNEDELVNKKKEQRGYYCTPCGMSMHMNDADDHLKGNRHTKLLQTIEERNITVDPEPDRYGMKRPTEHDKADDIDARSIKRLKTKENEHHCVTCNILIETGNLDTHLNGKKHAWNSKSPFHYTVKPVKGSDEVICRVCSVYMVDSPKQIKSHIDTVEHKEKFKEFLADNVLKERSNTFYCEPCNVSIMKMNEFHHVERLTHAFKAFIKDKNTEATVKDSDGNASEATVIDNKVNSQDTKYLCHICELHVPNHPSNIQQHNDGERHKKNMAAVKKELDKLSQSTRPVCELSPSTRPVSEIHYHMTDSNSLKQFVCRVCKSVIPKSEKAVKLHVNGAKHKGKYKILLEQNLIVANNEKLYCNACKKSVGNEKELAHIEDPKHESNLKHGSLTVGPVTAKNIDTKAEIAPESTKIPIDLFSIISHHFEKVSRKLQKCLVCGITIKNNNTQALAHAAEFSHGDAYREILKSNLLLETDTTGFYCGVCKCLVPSKGEFLHSFGAKHMNKQKEVSEKKRCDLCNVTAPMQVHMYTGQHISKLKKEQSYLHFCTDCGLLVTKGAVDQHLKYCKIIRDHKLVVRDDICFCIICDVYIYKELIEEHIATGHHKLRLTVNKALHHQYGI